VAPGYTRHLFGERLLGAGGLIAEEPAHGEQEYLAATHTGIGQPTHVADVHVSGLGAAVQAGSQLSGGGMLESPANAEIGNGRK